MKKIHALILIISTCICSQAQTWSAVGSGVNGYVSALIVYNGNLIASNSGGTYNDNIVQWNGSTWSAIVNGLGGGKYPYANAFAIYNGNLYAAGGYTYNSGNNIISTVVEWNGTSWSTLGTGMSGGVSSIAVYNGNLYVGGVFRSAGDTTAIAIAEWNGTDWSPCSGMDPNAGSPYVTAFTTYNGELIVCGSFINLSNSGSQYNIAEWNGNAWDTVSGALVGVAAINALTVYNGNLIIGGQFTTIGGKTMNNIAEWNGTSWSALGSGVTGGNYPIPAVYALTVYNGNLIVGGVFTDAGGNLVNNIAEWNGTSWSAMDSGVRGNYPGIYALTVYNGNLYAAGEFDTAGGKPANNIAEWCQTCSTGTNEISSSISSTLIFPNPSNGKFTTQFPVAIGQISLEVYNLLGQKVYSNSTLSNQHTIDLSFEPNGIYLYRLITENGNLLSEGKIIIEK